MYEVKCASPVLIVNPRLDELVLYAQACYVDGHYKQVTFEHRLQVLEGSLASRVLGIPFLHPSSEGYTDPVLVSFLDGSYLVLDDGSVEPLYQWVPCGHCAVCNSSKLTSYSQRARFAVEESGSLGYAITMTYNESHLPSDGLLCRRHIQLFFKRLRSALSRMWRFYGLDDTDPYFSKAYWRDKASRIKYIFSGEYGSDNGRPHYHILIFGIPYFRTLTGLHNSSFDDIMRQKLIQYAWRDSQRQSNGLYLSFLDYRRRYPKAYKTPADYDPESRGFVYIKEISSSSAVSYALKYAFKHNSDKGSGSIFGCSINLGLQFVCLHFDEVLNSSDLKLTYRSSVDGSVVSQGLCSYYLRKLLPSYSKLVSKDLRRVFVQFLESCSVLMRSHLVLNSVKHTIFDLRDRICKKFDFLHFEFSSPGRLSKLYSSVTFDVEDVVTSGGLDFVVHSIKTFANGLYDEVSLFNKYYAFLDNYNIDIDDVNRKLAVRDKFFSRMKSRTRSEILLQGLEFQDTVSEMISKSFL